LAVLKSAPPDARARAAGVLAGLGCEPGRVVPALVAALADDSRDVRQAAAEALGSLGPSARRAGPRGAEVEADLVSHALRSRLSDRDALVRVSAARALRRIGAADDRVAGVLCRELVVALLRTQEGEDLNAPRKAAAELGEMGKAGARAVPLLVLALNS